eukprot:TRINITY_DN2388_c0_g1_i1.p1 TRINITY_DN2388_c0_g1~~TRINITY_DN2388_c0_g1_i1.p1  ORF type:complete len:401 (+),score=101.94 TRINITY_DN2388_c0_g1_i1:161-1363(+)
MKNHDIQQLEMFNENLSSTELFDWFPGLLHLTILKQSELTELHEFTNCTNMRKLSIMNTQISEIKGLGALSNLKTLHLCDANITTIENMENLPFLQVLWLNHNKITSLAGLKGLRSLKTLYCCSNEIRSIGDHLNRNLELEELNLSNNQIGSFKEILHLTRLPKLHTLSFNDPHFGENPVCLLGHYQTYVLCHLKSLKNLDAFRVTEQSKQLAEATYLKKKMYYNMRIKALKRTTTGFVNAATDAFQSKLSQLTVRYTENVRALKDLQRLLNEKENGIPIVVYDDNRKEVVVEPSVSEMDQAMGMEKMSQHAVSNKETEIEYIKRAHELCKQAMDEISDQNIRRLVVEFETGGNIRLEDGKPGDIWYDSCEDLIKSRFVREGEGERGWVCEKERGRETSL